MTSLEVASPRVGAGRRFFHVHIMKTGGMSLELRTSVNFESHQIYPDALTRGENIVAKFNPKFLAELSTERRAEIRFFSVHMPFCAFDLVGDDVVLIAVLREPVARVVSHLKHAKRHVPGCERLSLEEIYDVPWLFDRFFDNHQVKMFAIRLEDLGLDPAEENFGRDSPAGPIVDDSSTERLNDTFPAAPDRWSFRLDEARTSLAKANLARVDVLGLTEKLDELLVVLETKYGLLTTHYPPANVGHIEEVSDELLARIATDNRHDIEFYEYARELYECRRAQG